MYIHEYGEVVFYYTIPLQVPKQLEVKIKIYSLRFQDCFT